MSDVARRLRVTSRDSSSHGVFQPAALPPGLDEAFLSVPRPGVPMFSEGAVPVVSSPFSFRNGLWIPKELGRSPQPLDQIATYVTGEQVFGLRVPTEAVEEHLARLPLEGVLAVCAELLADLDAQGRDQARLDRQFMDSFGPVGSARAAVQARLSDGRTTVVAPQLAMMVIKRAARTCGDTLLPGVQPGLFGVVWFGTADQLQRLELQPEAENQPVIGTGTPGVVEREVVAAHHFAAQRELPHLMAKFMRRWWQLPTELAEHPRVVDLPAAFEAALGFSLGHFIAVGVAIQVAVSEAGPRVSRTFFHGLGIPEHTVDAILGHVMTTVPALRAWAASEDEPQHWEFSYLERFPLIELDSGDLLVVRPGLVLQRFFGWLPAFDLDAGLEASGAPATRRERVKKCLEHLGEVYADETLRAQAGRHGLRHFNEAQLKAAFAPRGERRTCDSTIDDGRRWALFEMTSSRLNRESASASSAERLESDLGKLVGKAQQLSDTIGALRDGEHLLTPGESGVPRRRRYFPVLVMTEGFPVNPVTLTSLRQRVAELGLLVGDDVAPLQVLDVSELEILEGADPGELSLLDALAQKPNAALAQSSMRDYLLVERRVRASVPPRVEALWVSAFEVAKGYVRDRAE